MNVIVFIPIGMILGSLLRVKGSWLVALLIGCSISVTIESLQFFFMRGFSELDDVMHNTVGCLMGWCMVKGSRFMVIVSIEPRYVRSFSSTFHLFR